MGLLIAVFLSSLASYVAGRKGRSIGGWLAVAAIPAIAAYLCGLEYYSLIAPITATLILLALPAKWYSDEDDKKVAARGGSSDAYQKCPYCAEVVRKEAVKCRHCQSDISERGAA